MAMIEDTCKGCGSVRKINSNLKKPEYCAFCMRKFRRREINKNNPFITHWNLKGKSLTD